MNEPFSKSISDNNRNFIAEKEQRIHMNYTSSVSFSQLYTIEKIKYCFIHSFDTSILSKGLQKRDMLLSWLAP